MFLKYLFILWAFHAPQPIKNFVSYLEVCLIHPPSWLIMQSITWGEQYANFVKIPTILISECIIINVLMEKGMYYQKYPKFHYTSPIMIEGTVLRFGHEQLVSWTSYAALIHWQKTFFKLLEDLSRIVFIASVIKVCSRVDY